MGTPRIYPGCFRIWYTIFMENNTSPWIRQLNRTRPITTNEILDGADIAVIGGGIAGVTTAYYLLKHTNKKIVLLEAGKVAHGATGHNAGQVVSYFERSLFDIAETYGLSMAIKAQASVEHAWILLEEMREECNLQTPVSVFVKPVGFTSLTQVMRLLKDNQVRRLGGLPTSPILISDEITMPIEAEMVSDLWKYTPKENILSLLETTDERYIAVGQEKAGCMNSAMFTEELTGYLLATYKERFILCENTPVVDVLLYTKNAILTIPDGSIDVEEVILCTNGFENIRLVNHAGDDIDVKFHHNVRGYVGYQMGYLAEENHPPTAVTYFDDPKSLMHVDDAYYLLTRREFDSTDTKANSLISLGGEGEWLEDATMYKQDAVFPKEIFSKIDSFAKRVYKDAPKDIAYEFTWHGLMGFTRNNLRLIGREPKNNILMYNLGCNGIGILPSVFGARTIARIVNKEMVEKSIFDPSE